MTRFLRAFADRVEAAVEARLKTLPRAEIAGASWAANGAVIVVGDLKEAPPLVDVIAPEHLELAVAEPEPLADAVTNAGATFMGRFTPEAVGDYIAGANHVLPTSRTARFSSGLSIMDFVKRTSVVACDADALGAIGPAAVTLAQAEGVREFPEDLMSRKETLSLLRYYYSITDDSLRQKFTDLLKGVTRSDLLS